METQRHGEKETSSSQIQKIIIRKIENGDYLPGERIHSERKMADMYGVSRMAVQYALRELVKKGYLYRVRGSGTFVRKNVVDRMDLNYLSERGNSGITAIVKNHGAKIANKVLTRGIITGNFFSFRLGLEKGEEVYVLHRIRYGNDEPIAVEYTYVPANMFPEMDDINFEEVSLYDYMDSISHMPTNFQSKLQIIEVTEKERCHLGLEKQDPVYYSELIGLDEEGTIVEYTESYTRCDKFIYQFDAVV